MAKVQLFMTIARRSRNCTFCKHWYDPANSNLQMLSGARIEYDTAIEKPCEVRCGHNMRATMSCSKFVSKL